jgi:hypothetical protein
MERFFFTLALWLAAWIGLSAQPSTWPLELQVRVDGRCRPVYDHGGRNYIEAVRGCEYSLVLINHSNRRLAVALAVDGLNTIDARHTEARRAQKWVVGPYQTVEISGWQVSSERARRFYFTTEEDSYGAALGKTQNLGVISAVVYREQPPCVEAETVRPGAPAASPGAAGQPESSTRADRKSSLEKRECDESAKDFAATGMGDAMGHRVERIHMELEKNPCQSIRLRYEFREALVRLGVFPRSEDRLERRERAHGFESQAWCPEPR